MRKFPDWLKRRIPENSARPTWDVLEKYQLNTVCESALCPNRSECYSQRTATFMILGGRCTRRCGFCAIETGAGRLVEDDEPERVAAAAQELGLRYVVVTSVARDDLQDEGAGHFYRTVSAIRKAVSGVEVEVLTPDFHARGELIGKVCESGPAVYNHNLETVERLQRRVRPQAGYGRSLKVIETVSRYFPGIRPKSGLMLGLGETEEEVYRSARDLQEAGCEILTLGQYLPPTRDHIKLETFIAPDIFERMAGRIRQMGFKEVYAGPYVRSSYHAAETFQRMSS